MGFTAGMDAGQHEHSGSGDGREDARRVRWRGPEGRESVTAEMQLLAALEVAGISAAPDVLAIEEDGYVRESAPPLVRRGGRRSAGGASPATAERLALARAREDLEALVAALHERGWVLGAPSGRGLGVRADGGVIALDLSGLRRETALSARSADLHWIGTVLEDGERTLRRRVHGVPAAAAPVEGALDAGTGPEPEAPGPGPEPGAPEPEPTAPVRHLRRARTEGRTAGGRAAAERTGTRTRRRRRGAAIARVLADSRHRRTAALSAAAVLVAGLGTGLAVTITDSRTGEDGPAVASEQHGEGPEDPSTGGGPNGADGSDGTSGSSGTSGTSGTVGSEGADVVAPPPIEDPWALAAELAGARHAYLTGTSTVPVAADGGPAAQEDERIRAAYQGYEVRGGGPVVHGAELLEGPDAEGRAVLRVLTSTDPGQVVGTRGEVRETPGGGSTNVDLTLSWDGQRWRIQEARTL
jgi:hypothetical protein